MLVVGIDPGASGGLAILGAKLGPVAFKIPATERDTWILIRSIWGMHTEGQPPHAFIEKVGAMPTDARNAAFKFGQNYGMLRGFIIATAIPFEDVLPTKWQKTFGLAGKKGETPTQKKNRHKAKAQQLFPDLKITHAVADALLITEHGRRELSRRSGA